MQSGNESEEELVVDPKEVVLGDPIVGNEPATLTAWTWGSRSQNDAFTGLMDTS